MSFFKHSVWQKTSSSCQYLGRVAYRRTLISLIFPCFFLLVEQSFSILHFQSISQRLIRTRVHSKPPPNYGADVIHSRRYSPRCHHRRRRALWTRRCGSPLRTHSLCHFYRRRAPKIPLDQKAWGADEHQGSKEWKGQTGYAPAWPPVFDACIGCDWRPVDEPVEQAVQDIRHQSPAQSHVLPRLSSGSRWVASLCTRAGERGRIG